MVMLKFDQHLISLLQQGISFSKFQKRRDKDYKFERFYDGKGTAYYSLKNGFKFLRGIILPEEKEYVIMK